MLSGIHILLIILIVLFVVLLVYSYLDNSKSTSSLIEGMTDDTTTTTDTNNSTTDGYQPYNVSDPNNCLILSQQNAGNISVLNGRVDEIDQKQQNITDLKQQLDGMQTQIDELVQQQQDYATELAGGSTPTDITGTDANTTADVEDAIQKEQDAEQNS